MTRLPADPAVYATADEYRARTGASSSVPDDLLNEQLEAASRHIDNELRVAPGNFGPYSGTYIFSTDGGTVLRLRDEAGLAYSLRSVEDDGIKTDYDLSGVYNQEAWDLDDVWVWPRPRSAGVDGIPYHALELRPLSNVPSAIWPTGGGSVQIEGNWGWAETPAPIRDLTVHVAREMRDSMRGGAAARVEVIDDTSSYRDDAWRLWQTVKRRYGRIPARAR